MSGLPIFVRRSPFIFYALAVILGVWRFYNEWFSGDWARVELDPGDPFVFQARSIALYWGVAEAAYIFGTGIMIHVLIAIYDKVGGSGK